MMFAKLYRQARRLFNDFHRSVVLPPTPATRTPSQAEAGNSICRPLEQVILTDEVGRTLFEEYAQHRSTSRGNDETGWLLLGHRHEKEAVVLATLPAGAEADASVSHIRLGTDGQAVASRIVRQKERRLTILGVVHTHPGNLRRPSDGDYRGDSQWVSQLRGKEGIFAIGTADGTEDGAPSFAYQPRSHVQCWGPLRFSWYALGDGDRTYRPLPISLTHGPDLARDLHGLWPVLEGHANELDRLFRQQVKLQVDVVHSEWGAALLVVLPLVKRGDAIRVVIRPKEVRYYVVLDNEVFETDQFEDRVDRGVYLLLAELAAQQR